MKHLLLVGRRHKLTKRHVYIRTVMLALSLLASELASDLVSITVTE